MTYRVVGIWLFLVVAAVSLLLAIGSCRRVTEGNEALVERFGRFHRKLRPGLNFGIFPVLDEVVVEATTRECLLDIKAVRATTKDNFSIEFDVFAQWVIIDLYTAYYGFVDVENALTSLVSTTLRLLISKLYVSEVSSSIDRNLLIELDDSTNDWGIKVTRLYINKNHETESNSLIVSPGIVEIDVIGEIEWKAYNLALEKLQTRGVNLIFQGSRYDSKISGKTIFKAKYYPENLDRDKIYNDFVVAYGVYKSELVDSRVNGLKSRDKLSSKEEKLQEEVNYKLENIQQQLQALIALSSREINITLNNQNGSVEGDLQMENEQNHGVKIGNISGNVGAVGNRGLSQQNQGVTNFGEISGSVTNTINQLQCADDPEIVQLADLLKQLQIAIEVETKLSEDNKALALEQTGKLAEAAKTPANEAAKKPAKLAVGFLKGLVSTLPDTAKLAEACSKLLPLITSLLGL